MVAIVLPLAIGLLQSLLEQLERVSLSGGTFRQWVGWGFMTYVGVHVLLFRPSGLFRISHRVFSSLAIWLFGGQVATVEEPKGGKAAGKGAAKSGPSDPASQGSTLVAFSPYVVPVYPILVCAVGWLLARWWDRMFLDGPVAFAVGVTMAFHWLMTADDLQQQRRRWHLETYLLALSLVFVLTLLLGAACLPWAVPELSFVDTLGVGFSRTHTIYRTIIQRLFL